MAAFIHEGVTAALMYINVYCIRLESSSSSFREGAKLIIIKVGASGRETAPRLNVVD